jgi:cation diffusion facilitator family transporter
MRTDAQILSPGGPGAGGAVASGNEDDRRLYRIMLWCYFSVFPLMVVFIVAGVLSNSSAVIVVTAQRAISIAVQTFAIFAIREVMRDNAFRFPYGAGKLEDFAAFLCGVLYVPSGAYLAIDATTRLVHPQHVGYVLSMIPIAISAARMVVLYAAVRRVARDARTPAPLLRAYVLDFRIGMWSDFGVLVAFAIGWALVRAGQAGVAERVDPLVALAMSGYMVWAGVSLVRLSFRSLMDLPLPEGEQLRIMKVLAAHYADYEAIGTVYSRSSGKQRFVEIELAFPQERTLGEIDRLGRRMEESLTAEVPGLRFRVIPVAGDG